MVRSYSAMVDHYGRDDTCSTEDGFAGEENGIFKRRGEVVASWIK